MATQRQPKGDSSPESISVSGGGGTASSGNQLADILQRMGGIERSISYIEASAQDTQKKLDLIAKEVSEAKAIFSAFQPIITGLGKALWAVTGAIAVFVLGIFSMWLKHHMGW